jgi:hypothetical protein
LRSPMAGPAAPTPRRRPRSKLPSMQRHAAKISRVLGTSTG